MKHLKKALCLLLALSLFAGLTACSSCGRNQPVVMARGSLSLEADIYQYWLACYRAQFAYGETEENRERYAEIADLNIMKTVVAASLFDEYGLSLDDNARAVVDAAMASLIDHAGGTREQFEAQAAAYGIGYDGMKLAIIYEQKASALYTYLFGQNGQVTLTDRQYEDYYKQTYTHVRMIYIPYVDFVLSEDGDRIWDEEQGGYLYTDKTGKDLSAQLANTEAVRAALASDQSEAAFKALAETYDQDPAAKSYPYGYYFSSEVDYETYIPAVTDAALSLKAGELAEVRSAYGVHFILGLELDEAAYLKSENSDFFDGFPDRVGRYFYEELIEEHLTEVVVYREEKDKIRYAEVTPNFDLYW